MSGGGCVAREERYAQVLEHLDVMGPGAGWVRDCGGAEQDSEMERVGLGCSVVREVGDDGEAELAGAEDEDGACG